MCVALALSTALQPFHGSLRLLGFLGLDAALSRAIAQTSPPVGAGEGQALGWDLLRGPVSDGEQIYFDDANGSGQIAIKDLFQEQGAHDDVEAMQQAFGDDEASENLAAGVEARLSTENSQHALAYSTVRDSAKSRSHPDISSDPAFLRSRSVLSGDDPIFETFFDGCTQVEVPVGDGSIQHVEDYRYCDRVITPAERCVVAHQYKASLLRVVGGEGGLQSCGLGCMDLYVGKVGDNYWSADCSVFEQHVRVEIDNPDALSSAVLEEVRWDDHIQIVLNGQRIWNGPEESFPPETPGACEQRVNWTQAPATDLTAQFKKSGPLDFLIRVSVSGNGEGYARVRLKYDRQELFKIDDWVIGPECREILDGVSDGRCTLNSIQCLDGPAMEVQCAVVNGFLLCQDDFLSRPINGFSPLCRRGELTASCPLATGPLQCWSDAGGNRHCPQNNGSQPNGCAAFEAAHQCGFVSSQCLPFAWRDGRCYAYQETWDCGYDVALPPGKSVKVSCDGPIRCMGEECVSPPREVNPDFARAASSVSAMTWMAMDTDCTDGNPDNCRLFTGEAMECKKALGGYQNCCDTPVGVGLADYLQLTMATYDLAKKLQLGESLSNMGLNVAGAWSAVRGYATQTWRTIMQPFASAWSSLAQSYAGASVDALENFTIDALKQELTEVTAEFVTETFGPEVAEMFFSQTVNEAGETIVQLSETFSSALSVVMWAYTIYAIVNILIDIVWACEEDEFILAARREMHTCTHIGSYCKSDSPFGCIETRDVWCCYNSPLARIVMEGATPQLDRDYGTPEDPRCEGLTISQAAGIDWSKVNLDKWYAILAVNGVIPVDAAGFDHDYALDEVTRNSRSRLAAPNASERIQSEVDYAEHFEEAREHVREQLWSESK